ncbi:putative 3-oxoacyl-synthase [Xylariomycetidae sp. FL2044]|nr:putative 3-oxoacyl-synthase [Xylariomycetidae sp. FL2044]
MVFQQYEQELAHVLLTELLAYQFAMPVRWSETQSVLFDTIKAEKLVEFGPSPTLLNMAKKTLSQFNAESDSVNGIKRALLSTSANYDDLRYEVQSSGDEEDRTESEPGPEPVSADLPKAQLASPEASAATAGTPGPVKSDAPIPDIPLSAVESVAALVASSLKKPASEIKLDSSVKALSGGRSIVQNEIIGDLLEEFGPLADDVENMSLKELASMIQTNYDGKMRKCLRGRVEKMIASKMPGSFDVIAVRSLLSDRWGLAAGRQDAVLLLALGKQPAARLGKTEEAEAFLDTTAQAYLDSVGLSRQLSTAATSQQTAVVDSKVVQLLRDEQSALRKKIASILSGDDEIEAAHEDRMEDIQAKMDIYESELGEEFCEGIKPIFRATHQRSYSSVWNWGHVDLLDLYYRHALGGGACASDDSLVASLKGRYSRRLERARDYLLSKTLPRPHSSDPDLDPLRIVLESLSLGAAATHTHPPSSQDKLNSHRAPSSPEVHEIARSGASLLLEGVQDENDGKTTTQLLRRRGNLWLPDKSLSAQMNRQPVTPGIFTDKNVLITGAGPNSIGFELLKLLLEGGARVVVTTSRPMHEAGPIYQKLFASSGATGSRLVVLPCNQGSKQDIEDLISHIYDDARGLGWDLDFIIPFAALPEKGREIDRIDSKSELAHRAMLTNVLRIMGAVKVSKEARGYCTRPAQVVLPMSPNHGTFGNDGLYSESKIGLISLLNKWSSESWGDYLCLCGAIIGWTRGTGLMGANDAVAEEISKRGIVTFSTGEMAAYILGAMSKPVVAVCQTECLVADLSGGMGTDPGLAAFLGEIRQTMRQEEDIRRALSAEDALDHAALGAYPPVGKMTPPEAPLVDLDVGFPPLPNYAAEIQPLNTTLDGMVDLESVVVVVGFAEIGPWGGSRTRWEMEIDGELSIQGCIELAWMTGLIKHNPADETGWVDVATGTAVRDHEIKAKYEKHILENTGLRLIQPSSLDHPNRDNKQFLQEVVVKHDMEPFTASLETASEFAREHGDKVQIAPIPGSDQYSIRLKKGATLMIPKARMFDRVVGGQLPTGWDPRVYGLPDDIIDSVDRCTLMALVCAAETFLSAGITDVYELYRSIHVSELANCVGSGMGGGQSLQKLYRQRYLDRPVQSDILAEVFINTTGAWLNMLLMGAAGPTRTPVGACATALESLNQGYDLITSGAAKICLVGGHDDMTQDTSAEFANMKATNDSATDMDQGRAAHETSRPTASTRRGFVESEGCGMQLVTSAKVALELGLPIRAIVAHVQTASDGIGRSVPAPGKGIMVNVRKNPASKSPLLDINLRRRLLEQSLKSIRESRALYELQGAEDIDVILAREEKEARRRFGNGFWVHDTRISPLRGALAVWNLDADDIGVVSLHGTSTQLNEKNEVEVIHRQLDRLGRTPGNAALAVCQKYLTGHPKGAAAAWMLNGCCQILETARVPGNRNADDIDAALEPWEHLVFPNKSITVDDVKAFSVTSFGFGQKGAQALGVHPKFLFATIGEDEYREYGRIREERYFRAKQHFQNAFYGGRMVVLKDDAPYAKADQVDILTDASARFT